MPGDAGELLSSFSVAACTVSRPYYLYAGFNSFSQMPVNPSYNGPMSSKCNHLAIDAVTLNRSCLHTDSDENKTPGTTDPTASSHSILCICKIVIFQGCAAQFSQVTVTLHVEIQKRLLMPRVPLSPPGAACSPSIPNLPRSTKPQ